MASTNVSNGAGTSPAGAPANPPPDNQPPSSELDRASFEYLMENDISLFVDGVCAHLIRARPADPSQSVIEFLTARKVGYGGGVALAGENVAGGWLRIFDSKGTLQGSVDKLPFKPDVGIQLLVSTVKERGVYIALTDGSGQTEIRRYTADGVMAHSFMAPKPVTSIAMDRVRKTMWVSFKTGGGANYSSNGDKLSELSFPPCQCLVVREGKLWLLTAKSIEKRDCESGMLEFVIHLPDSMPKACSFVVGDRAVWAGAPNADGSPNFVGGFDISTGRPLPNFMSLTGCMLCFDRLRGGVWMSPRHGNLNMTFHNEKGTKMANCDLGKANMGALATDASTGLLWYFRIEDDARLGVLDPLRNVLRYDTIVPDVIGNSIHLVPM